MYKIVEQAIKIDLHIHSELSKVKDGEKVKNNTIENLDLLYKNLNEEGIQMIAITDHNLFNLELYNKIKHDILSENIFTGTLLKHLPGIEFDIELKGEKIHVIAIFNDSSPQKISNIPNVLENYEFDNDNKNAFKESTFKTILSKIDLDVILIAHQKSDVRANMHNDNLSRVGEKEFDNLISLDYFDAVEFRRDRVEGMLANYKFEHNLENLRYITGTDNHDWSVYPQQDKKCKQDITFTFMKSLPTFKGLVMALTDPTRLHIGDFAINKPYIKNLPIKIKGLENNIILSSGINVIIGDNSIGKSLIIEQLFNSKYLEKDKSIITGHKEYLLEKNIELDSIPNLQQFSVLYRGQGGIREDFLKESNLKNVDFFNEKFSKIDNDKSKDLIIDYGKNLIELLEQNQKVEEAKTGLNFTINVPSEAEDKHYHLKSYKTHTKKNDDYKPIINSLNAIIDQISLLEKNNLFTHDDKIIKIKEEITKLVQYYTNEKLNVTYDKLLTNVLSSYSDEFNTKYEDQQRQQETQLAGFRNDNINSYTRIVDAIKIVTTKKIDILEDFKDIKLQEITNTYGEYKFTSKNAVPIIDKKILVDVLLYPLRHISRIEQLSDLTINELDSKLKSSERSKYSQQNLTYEELYFEILSDYSDKYIFKQQYLINHKDENLITGNSPGKNALIFLDVLSFDNSHQLVVIDQPGDDVSQNRIATDLIQILKRMAANNKQIIIVTHKPELVVNLDVDNVIVLKIEESGEINIEYGALEYEGIGINKKPVNILEDVAEILDGGVETIRKRWKRYDKKPN